MSRRAYVTADRLALIAQTLDATDQQLLAEVAKVRLATARQLQRLVAAESLAEIRRLRRQLSRLTELDVLARLERRVGGRKSGSGSYVYGLGLAGQRLVAGTDLGRVRPPWTPRPSWLAHALLVSELYVRLREAERRGQLEIVRFEAEPNCWRPFDSGYGMTVLKPDAFIASLTPDYEQSHFVEVDRGTESPAMLVRKLDVYRSYWSAGAEQGRSGVFPQVLWLVPDDDRKGLLIDVAGRQPADAWQLHQVRTFADALSAFTGEPP
jgi:hypothetical protein